MYFKPHYFNQHKHFKLDLSVREALKPGSCFKSSRYPPHHCHTGRGSSLQHAELSPNAQMAVPACQTAAPINAAARDNGSNRPYPCQALPAIEAQFLPPSTGSPPSGQCTNPPHSRAQQVFAHLLHFYHKSHLLTSSSVNMGKSDTLGAEEKTATLTALQRSEKGAKYPSSYPLCNLLQHGFRARREATRHHSRQR